MGCRSKRGVTERSGRGPSIWSVSVGRHDSPRSGVAMCIVHFGKRILGGLQCSRTQDERMMGKVSRPKDWDTLLAWEGMVTTAPWRLM